MSQRPDSSPTNRPSVQVIERLFHVLEVLAAHPEPVSLKDISEHTGLHPSTAHRILNDLALGRFVERPEAGYYRLGMRLLELGNLVKDRLSVRDAALGPPGGAQQTTPCPALRMWRISTLQKLLMAFAWLPRTMIFMLGALPCSALAQWACVACASL